MNRALGRRQWLALVVAALLAPACATTSNLATADTAPLDRLLSLIVERLMVAPDVARTKWNTHAPIEDLAREQQIISAVGAGASGYNVPRDTAERFFRGQIDASKVVQRAMFAEYETAQQPPFEKVVDLDKEIRPTLDRLTPEMMLALGQAL
ncbi:MAG: gamma subclass chorismate mutase AroQ, partial [Vicinamibacterales bacterium]